MIETLGNQSKTSRKPFVYKRQIALLFFGIIGFIVAASWVLAINSAINILFSGWNEIAVKFGYALIVTILAIFLLWVMVKATDYMEA